MRSTDAEKKQREIAEVQALFERMPGLVEPGFKLEGCEPPDVIVRTPSGRAIGVEVVAPFNEQLARGVSALDRLAEETKRLLTARGVKATVLLKTTGGVHLLAQRGRIELLAQAIVELAAEHVTRDRPRHRYRRSDLPEAFVHLTEVVIEKADEPDAWPQPRVVAFGGSDREQVQHAIDLKNAKVASYRKVLPDAPLWLLVTGGTAFASGTQSGSVVSGEYESAFDRTFYVDAYDKTAFELRTRAS